MKRIILSCVLALIAIGLAIFQSIFINNTANKLYDNLNNNDIFKDYKQVERLSENWKENTKILNMFIKHENAENISKNLDEMIEMAKYKDYKRYDYLKARTKEQLRIISEGEQLLIENIF